MNSSFASFDAFYHRSRVLSVMISGRFLFFILSASKQRVKNSSFGPFLCMFDMAAAVKFVKLQDVLSKSLAIGL